MPAKAKRAKKSKKTPKIAPIPRGFNTVTPHLVISGASQALEFYKKAFGAKELDREAMPDGKLMHARVKIGDSMVMMADEMEFSPTKSPTTLGNSPVTLHIYSKDVDKLWQQALDAGAKSTMQLENMFWGERYGQLQDPFGHRWSVSMQIKMTPKEKEEKRKQAMAMFAQGQHPEKAEQATASAY